MTKTTTRLGIFVFSENGNGLSIGLQSDKSSKEDEKQNKVGSAKKKKSEKHIKNK